MNNQEIKTKTKTIESDKICSYCKGCPEGIDGNCIEYERFRGKKLSEIKYVCRNCDGVGHFKKTLCFYCKGTGYEK